MKHRNIIFSFIIAIFIIISGCAVKSPLIQASSSGDSSTVQKLLSEGANVNEPDGSGYTPLMYAIWAKKTETVKILLNKGADVNAQDGHGSDALRYAIQYAQPEIVKLLISNGADIKRKDSSGVTHLAYAASYLYSSKDYPQIDITKQLIKGGADINVKNTEGETLLDIALSRCLGDIVDELTRRGVNIWKPEAGKARLFFVGDGLWDYNTVYVGNQNKVLNHNKFIGLAFLDVEPGKHTVLVSEKPAKPTPVFSIDTTASQTYYLQVTQDMKRRLAHYAMAKLSNVEIIPLKESEAKQKIKEILNQKK